jgi:hypothetical protein
MPNPKEKLPEGTKPLAEVAHLTMRAFNQKNAQKDFQEAVTAMVETPDSPGGRITEDRFRDVLKTAAMATLSPEEVESIFPTPPSDSRKCSKDPKHAARRGSKSSVSKAESVAPEGGAA